MLLTTGLELNATFKSEDKMKYFIIAILLTVFLSGCETFKGMGRDIENTAGNIQDFFS